jgi:hypothetical protein
MIENRDQFASEFDAEIFVIMDEEGILTDVIYQQIDDDYLSLAKTNALYGNKLEPHSKTTGYFHTALQYDPSL